MWEGNGFTRDAEPIDWHLTHEEAARRGLELIDLKRKQIAKELDNLLVIEYQLKSELNLNQQRSIALLTVSVPFQNVQGEDAGQRKVSDRAIIRPRLRVRWAASLIRFLV